MAFALILVSLALVACLALLIFGKKAPSSNTPARNAESEERIQKLSAELEKKRKDVEDLKLSLNDLKDELKQTKRKLYETRQEEKSGSDLVKARAEVERQASTQLEIVRSELGAALAEIQRLKVEGDTKGRKVAPVQVAAPAEPEKVQRVIRELSEADKEKMERLESQAAKDRAKAQELDRDLKRIKSRLDTQQRVYNVTKGEHELLKDKFNALEKRLNRTLLEKDLTLRALKDLEKKSGVAADRTELTAEEVAASDRHVEEQQQKAAQEADAREAAAKAAAEASVTPPAAADAQPN